ncbi:hypothetical protein [Rufibacter ruber]|uniref:hypothetical protein n=1 Tax=Rufibacter ruber TaxID=1783499 RepID=UPI0008318507|nr:hypothetical protein [Rufibacter ruber]
MQKLRKYIVTVLAIPVLGLVCLFLFLEVTDKLPYKNYRDFSTSSGYVYCEVRYKDSTFLVVGPNSWVYSGLNQFVFDRQLNPFSYELKMFMSTILHRPIEVNQEYYAAYEKSFTDKSAADKLIEKQIIKEIAGKNVLPLDISVPQDQLVYFLVKNNIINCLNECETGRVALEEIEK